LQPLAKKASAHCFLADVFFFVVRWLLLNTKQEQESFLTKNNAYEKIYWPFPAALFPWVALAAQVQQKTAPDYREEEPVCK
jgi:hypothetical protein